jgi:hypothetical protein
MLPVLIGCRGNDPDAPKLLKAEGWRYGFRSDATPYGWPYFVDIKWCDYIWSSHLAVIREWRPVIAMVADYESLTRQSFMLAQIRDISSLGVRPMVCPKFSGAVADIPKGCIVAVSVPTDYAGFLPEPSEVKGRELHLLGGHPDQFRVLIQRYNQSKVVSIDCSAIFQKAQFGAFWSAKRNTWRHVKHRFSTHALTRMSARQVTTYLGQPPKLFLKQRKRLYQVGFELKPSLFQI